MSATDIRQVNNDGKTPQEPFTEQHTDLMEKGGKWMKETATQCMIVAALIATIMFAAAFTLPGGNNSHEDGHPIFLKRSVFIVFAVTDAISLCTSLQLPYLLSWPFSLHVIQKTIFWHLYL